MSCKTVTATVGEKLLLERKKWRLGRGESSIFVELAVHSVGRATRETPRSRCQHKGLPA